ncbi:hypothetical protein LL252_05295 [Alcanivorax marinus]|uniref:Uncharacterized protein n=1 Tax=Alloalcanivorax marinus TaxID=1177169 RepID=A0A9Q3YNM9_9GAMM|nr:hypothetical protein [Alloalcanivorax marinus]MCC4307980.1 hypothetical protein [Alloalcanivorax marinus]
MKNKKIATHPGSDPAKSMKNNEIAKKFASFGALEALFHREKRPDKQGGGV